MLHTALIVAHVAAGGLGLLAGPLALLGRRRRGRLHVRAGWVYLACAWVLCTTALALVALDPGLWGFAVIAVATLVCAGGAVVVRRGRRAGWLPLHANLALSSYVSFVTAFVVQTAGGWWWVVPVVVGSLATSVTVARLSAGTRVVGRAAPVAAP